MKDITVNKDKFDAVLRRMLEMKPISKAEISAKIKSEKVAKAKKTVQKMDRKK
ncbi:hypothetical protein [Tunturiibacter gelidiferens]|uniref:Uncharacterized protein n=1 Tax=Tunturiibacter gelidiferens TaxID=3069689 RepID=A0AAU7Z1Q2_9BACT